VKVAAIQLEPRIGDVRGNLIACERMANEAGEKGAKWIILPEFFTTGMAFNPRIASAIQPKNNKVLDLLYDLAKRHQAYVGGSFLMRDEDQEVRNAFFLVSPKGIVGRHNKDLPTMWENAFYVGGKDDGIINTDEFSVGASLCWEFMRSQTAKRLRGKVDLVVGGSCWWSVPKWQPTSLTKNWEMKNGANAFESVRSFATYVGAPIIHAAHVGKLECKMLGLPGNYKGFYEAGSMIVDSEGKQHALRNRQRGEGVVIADISIGRTNPKKEIPSKYWLHSRGPLPSFAWHYQRWHGKRWYKKNIANK